MELAELVAKYGRRGDSSPAARRHNAEQKAGKGRENESTRGVDVNAILRATSRRKPEQEEDMTAVQRATSAAGVVYEPLPAGVLMQRQHHARGGERREEESVSGREDIVAVILRDAPASLRDSEQGASAMRKLVHGRVLVLDGSRRKTATTWTRRKRRKTRATVAGTKKLTGVKRTRTFLSQMQRREEGVDDREGGYGSEEEGGGGVAELSVGVDRPSPPIDGAAYAGAAATLHRLWTEYMDGLLKDAITSARSGSGSSSSSIDAVLSSADLHGCKISVTRSTNTQLVSKGGIVLKDSSRAFLVLDVEAGNRLRVLPKQNTAFRITLPRGVSRTLPQFHYYHVPKICRVPSVLLLSSA